MPNRRITWCQIRLHHLQIISIWELINVAVHAIFLTGVKRCISLRLSSSVMLRFGIPLDNVSLAVDQLMASVVMEKIQIHLTAVKEVVDTFYLAVSSFVTNTFVLSISLKNMQNTLWQLVAQEIVTPNMWNNVDDAGMLQSLLSFSLFSLEPLVFFCK